MYAVKQDVYGGPEVLRVVELPRPKLGARGILVEVQASELTQGDRRIRAADFPGLSALFGRLLIGLRGPRHVSGTTFAGRVVAIGARVTRFAVGDAVFGIAMAGAHAEYLAVGEASTVARMPAGISYAEAAAIPYGASTALSFLRDMARLRQGERALIVGASGGVGRFALQVARHLGAEVTAVLSRDAELARALGAHHVLDYTQTDLTRLRERYEVIFDCGQHGSFARYRPLLAANGRYASLHMSIQLCWEALRSRFVGSQRAMSGVVIGNAALMDTVRLWVERGAIRATVARRFRLDELTSAHRALERGRVPGSIVVEVAGLQRCVPQPLVA